MKNINSVDDLVNLHNTRRTSPAKAKAARSRSLADKVAALIASANENLADERKITTRTGLLVASRAVAELSSLSRKSRQFGALRAVNNFITLASTSSPLNPLTASASAIKNADLLPLGHPASSKTRHLAAEKVRELQAEWYAADKGIDEEVRPLVAAAFRAEFGSPEHTHAITRLSKAPVGSVPKDIMLMALVASFKFGNSMSSAARRARVALQLRDRRGRWIDMGRGLSFKFNKADGSVGSASGAFVGHEEATATAYNGHEGSALIQVRDHADLPDGIYRVNGKKTESYQARIPGMRDAHPSTRNLDPSFSETEGIPNQADLIAGRTDTPLGWSAVSTDEKTGAKVYQSDDDYQVVQTGDSYTLHRMTKDGAQDKAAVGTADSWAGIQKLATADSDAYDDFKSGRRAPSDRDVQARLRRDSVSAARTKENESLDKQIELAESGMDASGAVVPKGWRAVPSADGGFPHVKYHKMVGTDPNDRNKPVYAVATVSKFNGAVTVGPEIVHHYRPTKYDSWDDVQDSLDAIVEAANEGVIKSGTDSQDLENRIPGKPMNPLDLTPDKTSADAIAKLPSDEEIYNERLQPGNTLQKVADKYGVDRKYVRAAESRHAKTLKPAKSYEGNNEDTSEKITTAFNELHSDYESIGLDPDGSYTDEEALRAWLDKAGLQEVDIDNVTDGPHGAEATLDIPNELKDQFAYTYSGDASWEEFKKGYVPSATEEKKPADKTPEDLFAEAADFLNKHMDATAWSEAPGIGISVVQDDLKSAEKAYKKGDIKEALSQLEDVWHAIDSRDPGDGVFPRGENGEKAAIAVDELITMVEQAQPSHRLPLTADQKAGVFVDWPQWDPSDTDTPTGDPVIKNALTKNPNGKSIDIQLGEYRYPENSTGPNDFRTELDTIVKAANKLGIFVEFSPQQESGSGIGANESTFRFTYPYETVNRTDAIRLMGFEGPGGNKGPLGNRFLGEGSKEEYDDVYNQLTGANSSGSGSGDGDGDGGDGGDDGGDGGLGEYKNSSEFIEKANSITKDWPTVDYATYVNDTDPDRVEMSFKELPAGSKIIATSLNGEGDNQLLVKLPDGNYILSNNDGTDDGSGMPHFEQIYPAASGGADDLYGDKDLSWEDMTLERLTSGDPESGFNPLDEYGFFKKYGVPKRGEHPGGPDGAPYARTQEERRAQRDAQRLARPYTPLPDFHFNYQPAMNVNDPEHPLYGEDISSNHAFEVAVAKAWVDHVNEDLGITTQLIETIDSGRNSYMTLRMSDKDYAKYISEYDVEPGDDGNAPKFAGDQYLIYTNFPDMGDQFGLNIEDFNERGPIGSTADGEIDLGNYENSPKFIKNADKITSSWPTMDYATYREDNPEFGELPEGSKLVATSLDGEGGPQLLAKLPDGNYILVSEDDDEGSIYEVIYSEESGGAEDRYGDADLSWEDMTLERLTSQDPESGFNRLDEYGFYEKYGIPKKDDGNEGGDDDNGGGGGVTPPTRPVAPVAPSDASVPKQIAHPDVPLGVFQFRGVEYEPEGRVDEESSNYTDDPKKLAPRYTVDELVRAYRQAITGISPDAVVDEILDANVEDTGEVDADGNPIEAPRRAGRPRRAPVADTPEAPTNANPALRVSNPSGAGQLEFSAGPEWVPAEALYNALWESGVDPNRVTAEIYDAINGNNRNSRALDNAGSDSPEDKIVSDIMGEISAKRSKSRDAIGDALDNAPKDIVDPEEEEEIVLDEDYYENSVNVPTLFNNVDYYNPDPEKHEPTYETPDESGITDDPRLLAKLLSKEDLTELLIGGITDGSGTGLVNFGDEDFDGTIPVEAFRDALQLLSINTNDIISNIPDEESSDDDEDTKPKPKAKTKPKPTPSQTRATRPTTGQRQEPEVSAPTNTKLVENLRNGDRFRVDGSDNWKIVQSVGIEFPGGHTYIVRYKDEVTGDEREFTFSGRLPVEVDNSPTTNADSIRTSDDDGAIDTSDGESAATSDLMTDPLFEPLIEEVRGYLTASEGILDKTDLIAVNEDGSMMLVRVAGMPIVISFSGSALEANNEDEYYVGPAGAANGWRPLTDTEKSELMERLSRGTKGEEVDLPEITVPDFANTPPPPPPTRPWPGNRRDGYRYGNVAKDRNGDVIGGGDVVKASLDGRLGRVDAIENKRNAAGEWKDYVRIRNFDGTTVTRSARQITLVTSVYAPPGSGNTPAPTPTPVVDPALEMQQPADLRLRAPMIYPTAPSGDGSLTYGVANQIPLPVEFANDTVKNIKEIDYMGLGPDMASQVAHAGRTRASLDAVDDLLNAYWTANPRSSSADPRDPGVKKAIDMLLHAWGNGGTTFGHKQYVPEWTSVRISRDSISSLHSTYNLNGAIKNQRGSSLGTVNRIIRTVPQYDGNGTETSKDRVVSHGHLIFHSKREQQNGFAAAFNAYMENWYYANKVEKVKVMAAGGGDYVGAYVWALQGFNFSSEYEAGQMVARLKTRARTSEEKKSVDRLERMIANATSNGNIDKTKLPTPLDIALVGWRPGLEQEDTWLGQTVMKANGWYGEKNLTLNYTPVERGEVANYRQLRAADARVKGKANTPNVSQEFISYLKSTNFQQRHPELEHDLELWRDVMSRNSSLAVLSPQSKNALGLYVSEEMLRGSSSSMSTQDAINLRNALHNEFLADNPGAGKGTLGVGAELSTVSMEDVENSNVPGFNVDLKIGAANNGTVDNPSGDIYKISHIDTGQVFFYKNDEAAASHSIDPYLNEVSANTILNGLGLSSYAVIRSEVPGQENHIIMRPAGSDRPLGSTPISGYQAETLGIPGYTGLRTSSLVKRLARPDDILKLLAADWLTNNVDRHNGNYMLALSPGNSHKLELLAIDNSLALAYPGSTYDASLNSFTRDDISMGATIYEELPSLVKAMGAKRAQAFFENAISQLLENAKKPGAFPPGAKTDAIEQKWGSTAAFISMLEGRLTGLLTAGSEDALSMTELFKGLESY